MLQYCGIYEQQLLGELKSPLSLTHIIVEVTPMIMIIFFHIIERQVATERRLHTHTHTHTHTKSPRGKGDERPYTLNSEQFSTSSMTSGHLDTAYNDSEV
jgi:hypothetical protein